MLVLFTHRYPLTPFGFGSRLWYLTTSIYGMHIFLHIAPCFPLKVVTGSILVLYWQFVLCTISCFYHVFITIYRRWVHNKDILLVTYFSLFSFRFALCDYCLISGLGGGGGRMQLGAYCAVYFARDLLNLICLKYVGFLLICYLVILLDSVIYCSL
jgi:hypothetical protein